MTITFNKTGKRTNSFLGDTYKSEYIFTTTNKSPIAKFTYSDFNATLETEGRTYQIKPVHGIFTINEFIILEGDSPVGQKKTFKWFNRLSIKLLTGKSYKLKRLYKSFWDRFINRSDYYVQLQNENEIVSYSFTKGMRFENGYFNERYRELKGQIETDLDNSLVSFLGVFLIEQLLDQERDTR
ncbi:hypothetical protein [Ohtaekwangia koreensis]|uniref:Uncharacterized protein n=1 Tax=Ohtaekwangia koreensis TaxID=688867 RepID=A0A1T5ML65_9BACT|nr:hypothetical protein [Ohtaekwangia koreensis]SKC88793.1 hypothetical protein SAMN05660236_5695 [Ohtaekwangia koreensis]